jgi:D-glycero-alpha-D-manno-heptose-7-phosphate kinase
VSVEPVLIHFGKRLAFERHLLLFYTGMTRDASSVLAAQKTNIDAKFSTLCEMADSVLEFRDRLQAADFCGLGAMLCAGWEKKRSLASTISNSSIDAFCEAGLDAGAWGAKVIGAGGGGCVLFIAEPAKQPAIRAAVARISQRDNLQGFREIPLKFTQAGADILFNADSAPRKC